MAADPVFVDTNVLVYATQRGHGVSATSRHLAAAAALRQRNEEGVPLVLSRQVLREYLAVVTRPQGTGSSLPVAEAAKDVRRFAQLFRILEDGGEVTAKLLELIEWFPTGGAQIHDANIVATMLVHGVGRLLTFNHGDFARFVPLIALEPLTAP
jgi:predicted nucleic acid-binding protein